MNSLDDRELKAEIEEIVRRIDNIIKNVNQIQPVGIEEKSADLPQETISD